MRIASKLLRLMRRLFSPPAEWTWLVPPIDPESAGSPVTVRTLRDNHGHLESALARLPCFTRSTLAHQRLQEALSGSDQYARRIIDCSLDMIITTDSQRRIVEFNQAAQETFGYTRAEVLGKHIGMLYGNPHDGQSVYRITFKEGKYVGEVANKRKNGELFISLLSASILRDDNGAALGIVGVSRDITGRKQAEEKLHYLSFHDILTGLHNRAYLEREWERINQAGHFPVSAIMADVDGLKKTNDRLGHAVGDELLRQVGVVLASTFRSEDVIARIGGDEFVVLLPGLATMEAEEALGRLKNNLANYNSTHAEVLLSLSLGVATAEQSASLAEVLRRADKRMYEDKTQSRVSASAIAGSARIRAPEAFSADVFS